VYCGDLGADDVRVELYADARGEDSPVCVQMTRAAGLTASDGYSIYSAAVGATRAPIDFTVRVLPERAGVAIPLEASHILWQR